jgi:hypothetical protein
VTTTEPALPSRSEPPDTSTPVTAGSTSFIPNRASTEPSSEPTSVPQIEPKPTTTVPHVSSSTAPHSRDDAKKMLPGSASDD